MKKLLKLCFLFSSLAAQAYYGHSSQEGELLYTAKLVTKMSKIPSRAEYTKNISKSLLEKLQTQTSYLMGHFQSTSFYEQSKHRANLSDASNQKYKILNMVKTQNGEVEVEYQLNTIIIADSNFYKDNKASDIQVRLPVNPDTVYSLSKGTRKLHPCTDAHYNSEEDFWYFWDPELPNCKLANNLELVQYINAQFTPNKNSVNKYPEYSKLYLSRDESTPLKISLFIGYLDSVTDQKTAKKDQAFDTFNSISSYLEDEGFTATIKNSFVKIDSALAKKKGLSHQYIFSKTLNKTSLSSKSLRIEIEVVLADTDASSEDPTFNTLYSRALTNSQVVFYDGHSGLGANLDLANFSNKMSDDLYQIFFFNGCSSYTYFTKQYLEGHNNKNIDVISAGLTTYSDSALGNITSFLDGFIRGRKISYNTILSRVEKTNNGNGTYLTGVSGEEDNQFLKLRD